MKANNMENEKENTTEVLEDKKVDLSTPPEGMKDPVLMVGRWEERVPPPPTAGTTTVDVKTLDPVHDKEEIEAIKGIPFRKADKAEKANNE